MAIEISPSTPSSPVPTVNGISVIWLGNWDNARVYRRNEGVFYNNSSFRANTTTAQEPSLTATDWDLLSQGVDVSNINNHIANTSNPHSTTAAQVGAIPTTEKGIASGVATLDSGGKIPDVQITSAIARLTNVTAAQVGNTTAQWNADKIQGVNVHTATPTNGQVLTYSTSNNRYEPSTPSGSGGGGKIIQVINSSVPFWSISTSGTQQSTTLSASITPTNASSTIYITGALTGVTKSTSVNTHYFSVQVFDGTNGYTVAVNVGRRADLYAEPVPIILFLPASNTSTTTYTVRCTQIGGGIISTNTTNYLTLMEIAP
jgi:hypothetical protein